MGEYPVGLVLAALTTCRRVDSSSEADPFRCAYVMRLVWRNTQTQRASGQLDAVVAEFGASPAADFDRAFLLRPAGRDRTALDSFLALTAQAPSSGDHTSDG